MSTDQDKGGPAFPVAYEHSDATCEKHGMTLRDYFAAKAMQGIVSVLHQGIRPCDIDRLAHDAYGIADAMLKARGANQ